MAVNPGFALAAVAGTLALAALAGAAALRAQGQADVAACQPGFVDLCGLRSLDEDLAAARLGWAAVACVAVALAGLALGAAQRRGLVG